MITNKYIDNGKPFDWGRVSDEYAKYRDIYPEEFYRRIHSYGICTKGQRVLDLGTGTGVIPRNMYRFGAQFTAADISPEQIEYAKTLSEGMNIDYICASAEEINFPEKSFEAITACQCYWYFDNRTVSQKAHEMLKDSGKLVFLSMAWLPFEDEIAGKSEDLILRFNPDWSGCGEVRHDIWIADDYLKYFHVKENTTFLCDVPFTRESWNGRIKACRGIGASLPQDAIDRFEKEHMKMLNKYPESFTVKHFCAICIMEKKKL